MLVKMHRAKYMWITCIPMAWLVIVCFTAGFQKIFSSDPYLGFLAQADKLARGRQMEATATLVFNNRLDAGMTALLLVLVAIILADSLRVWVKVLSSNKPTPTQETPFVATKLVGNI